MSRITDFNPGARNDARRDDRYAVVLEQVRKMAWPAGNPMLPGSWADTLATDVMAAVRKREGLHRLITHHAYEGPGECRAMYYGRNVCSFPEEEHSPTEETLVPDQTGTPTEQRQPLQNGDAITLTDFNMGSIIALEPADPTIEITGPGGQPLVTIHTNTGAIDYGPGYTPDAAAKEFWAAMQSWARYAQAVSVNGPGVPPAGGGPTPGSES
ncbi:hypothetical protein [Streptomyces sp. NPDC047981]|uniref:hypothetical protein n=1 Tax=Streptomyces sp. NPDC047981 TaxID=3154610 RepID=UPI00343EAA24